MPENVTHKHISITPGANHKRAHINSSSTIRLIKALSSVSLLSALIFSYPSFANIVPDSILSSSPNLEYERDLLLKHNELAARYQQEYNTLQHSKQPANKTEKCIVTSDLLDGQIDNSSLVFWEGSCKDGRADGFGRLYVIYGGRKTFEMLSNFKSEDPDQTITYFYKNTKVESQTEFFYGKSNRYNSSGISITRTHLDQDLLVSMEYVDKVQLVTYEKETSKNSNYILNILDYGNYGHFIHDLKNTAYRSLAMSYKLVNAATGKNYGYALTGLKTGEVQGELYDLDGNKIDAVVPNDVIEHIQVINEEIEVTIEDSIKNVIESLPVVDAYLNVICDPHYDNPVCRKMECKLMCDTKATITPDDATVKELLLRLVDHHNRRPLKLFLQAAQANASAN